MRERAHGRVVPCCLVLHQARHRRCGKQRILEGRPLHPVPQIEGSLGTLSGQRNHSTLRASRGQEKRMTTQRSEQASHRRLKRGQPSSRVEQDASKAGTLTNFLPKQPGLAFLGGTHVGSLTPSGGDNSHDQCVVSGQRLKVILNDEASHLKGNLITTPTISAARAAPLLSPAKSASCMSRVNSAGSERRAVAGHQASFTRRSSTG